MQAGSTGVDRYSSPAVEEHLRELLLKGRNLRTLCELAGSQDGLYCLTLIITDDGLGGGE